MADRIIAERIIGERIIGGRCCSAASAASGLSINKLASARRAGRVSRP